MMVTIVPTRVTHPVARDANAPMDTYSANEDVYATGSGFATVTNVDTHGIPDRDGDDGDPIPADVTGSVETVSIVDGDVCIVLVWNAPLTPGVYDIVIYANQNDVYNASTDGLDSGSPGFVVIVGIDRIIALISLLCVIGTFRIGRKFN